MPTPPPLRIDVLTLFPDMFQSVLGASILKRAAEHIDGRPPVVSYHLTNIRDYTTDKHQKVDQPPFGGGPGMVIQCQPVWDALEAVEAQDARAPHRILVSPQGQTLTQRKVEQLAQKERLLIIAGHYEGIDQRAIDAIGEKPGGLDHISVGDYVLSGGELPAMTIIDAVVRLRPGALGHEQSAHFESFSEGQQRLLDHPHYTRPRTWHSRDVPDVLLTGDHAKIEQWRREQSQARTKTDRPDLLETSASQTPPAVVIRDERKEDTDAVDHVLRAAFPTDAEAKLVAELRKTRDTPIALVATRNDEIVGQITFSPVTVADQPSIRGLLALAPVTVHPTQQNRGIGAALVREGLARCKHAGVHAVFVLGDPDYYKRFGFEPAAPLGFTSDFGAGPEFMVRRLRDLPEHVTGHIRYAAPFNALRDA